MSPLALLTRLDDTDWAAVAAALDTEGLAILPGLLPAPACQRLTGQHAGLQGRLGLNGLAHLAGLEALRHLLYARLQPTANRWAQGLGGSLQHPAELPDFLALCHQAGQRQPLSALRCLPAGSQQPLHQQADALVFPLQACLLLSEPGVDFTGGELVLAEQRPRMQTRPLVPPLRQGDIALFASRYRPHRGSQGFYRTSLHRAVSRVRSGTRVAVDLVFHDGGHTVAE